MVWPRTHQQWPATTGIASHHPVVGVFHSARLYASLGLPAPDLASDLVMASLWERVAGRPSAARVGGVADEHRNMCDAMADATAS